MSFEPQFRLPRRWGVRAGIAIIVIALVAGLAVWISSFFNDSGPTEPHPGPPAATEPAAHSGRVANGCLGGQALTAQTVLTAQRDAQLDDIGAAEFAATLMRWGGGAGGAPPADEVLIVLDAIRAANASEKVMVHDERLAGMTTDERQGIITSTTDGGYYIESATDDEVVVSILTVDTAPDPEAGEIAAHSSSWTLERSTGKWMLVDFGGTREVEDMIDIMVPFVGGC